LFLPLSLIEIVANHAEKHKMIRPKELRISKPLQQIYNDFRKSSILQFLNEIIYKSIKEEEPNPDLFSFLSDAIISLDKSEESVANYHLHFLIKLSQFLGFYPMGKYDLATRFFNLQEGVFTNEKSNYSLDENMSKLLHNCLSESFELIKNKEIRRSLTEKIVQFYEFHIPGFGNVKSIAVLHDISI
jgi:DNA repair protein RecO (recombination protein O)